MKVGFTGTQAGMAEAQEKAVYELLHARELQEFHHGDCVGADEQAHDIATAVAVLIVVHPPTDPSKRAFCLNADRVLEPRPYLDRNRDIVDAVELLIAAPRSRREEVRSGTWSTVRYARKQGKPRFLVFPDGSVSRDEGDGNGTGDD